MKPESKIQQEIFEYYHNSFCLKHHNPRCVIFSVPNGGTRNQLEAITLKATGLLAGVSDLIVVEPNRVIFVEVKTDTGKQSDKQIEFQNKIVNLGHEYYLVRNLDDFKKLLNYTKPENNKILYDELKLKIMDPTPIYLDEVLEQLKSLNIIKNKQVITAEQLEQDEKIIKKLIRKYE